MKIRVSLTSVCACATLVVSASAYGQFGDPPQGGQPAQQQQQAQQQPPGQPPGQAPGQQPQQQIVAKVNGDAITMHEYASALEPQLQRANPADPNVAQQIRQQVMSGLIESRLVEQYLIKEGPDVTQEEVSGVIDRYKQQVESQGVAFDQFMESKGYTEKDLNRRVQGSLAWQKFQQQHLTDDNLQEHFESNQQLFQAEHLEEVKNQVAQSYVNELWGQIVQETKPKAEIEVVQPQQPQGGIPAPGQPPQGNPQGGVPQ